MRNSGTKKLQAVCVIAAVAAVCAASVAPRASAQTTKRLVTQAVDESQRVALRGNVHPLARAEFDKGAMADTQPINRIYLLLNRSADQQTALDKLMLEQMDKSSPNYHQWLTPEQYGSQFGPSDEDIQAVKSWLSTQGFTVVKVNAGKTIVEFNGTVGSVRKAFGTEIHHFLVKGEKHFANISDPKIPAALAPAVMGIVSLHNFRKESHIKRFGKFRRDLLTGEIRPLFTFTDVNGTFFGMGPADFAKIYNVPNGLAGLSGFDGTGQSIAIVARSNINIQDVIDFRNMFGLTPANNVTVILNGADPGLVSGDEGEADLDVEWSGAVAPKATIKFVVSESEDSDAVDGVDASATYIVDNNIAPVMSESFGSCEAQSNNAFNNALWQQAAAQGITVSVSAGDNGSAGCDNPNNVNSASLGIAVSGTASTPFNVAVGGTDFDDSGNQPAFWDTTNTSTTTPVPASAKGYIPEIPWNDSCATAGLSGCNSATTSTNLNIVAGSGGPSSIYSKTQAPFQVGFGDGQRDIPDVSLFAADGRNKSFYIICESDQDIPGDTGCNLTKFVTTSPFHDFQTVGGTSASAPAFAGIMALVNQKTGQRQGNANFVLYSLAKSENFTNCNSSNFTNPTTALPSTCVFIDVTKSNNAVPCVAGKPNCSNTSTSGNGVLQSNGVAAFTAGTGYDLATGLGSINVNALLTNWAVPSTHLTATTLSPATVTTSVDTSVALSGSVTSGSGTPTGLVVIENAVTGTAIDTATLSGTAYSVNTTKLPGGTYTIKAHYGGDGTFGPSDSGVVTVNSTPQNSKVLVQFVTFNSNGSVNSISTAAQNVPFGSAYILRVDVANNLGTPCENFATGAVAFICPTGTITLKDNGSALNDFPSAQTPNATNIAHLNGRGFIEDQPIQLNTGSHTITAAYSGDASYNAQPSSNALSITITQAATATHVVATPSTITSGATVMLTAAVSSNSNADKAHAPSGTIQFMNGSTNLGSPVTCSQVGSTSSAGASCIATFSTPLSALAPPLSFDDRWRTPPLEWLAALFAMLAVIFFIGTRRLRGPHRAYAYATSVAFLVASIAIAGCSGTGSGGGGGGKTITINAKYSGDTNYATSTGSGIVRVQ
jgi:subtilase family serine protease